MSGVEHPLGRTGTGQERTDAECPGSASTTFEELIVDDLLLRPLASWSFASLSVGWEHRRCATCCRRWRRRCIWQRRARPSGCSSCSCTTVGIEAEYLVPLILTFVPAFIRCIKRHCRPSVAVVRKDETEHSYCQPTPFPEATRHEQLRTLTRTFNQSASSCSRTRISSSFPLVEMATRE